MRDFLDLEVNGNLRGWDEQNDKEWQGMTSKGVGGEPSHKQQDHLRIYIIKMSSRVLK